MLNFNIPLRGFVHVNDELYLMGNKAKQNLINMFYYTC